MDEFFTCEVKLTLNFVKGSFFIKMLKTPLPASIIDGQLSRYNSSNVVSRCRFCSPFMLVFVFDKFKFSTSVSLCTGFPSHVPLKIARIDASVLAKLTFANLNLQKLCKAVNLANLFCNLTPISISLSKRLTISCLVISLNSSGWVPTPHYHLIKNRRI